MAILIAYQTSFIRGVVTISRKMTNYTTSIINLRAVSFIMIIAKTVFTFLTPFLDAVFGIVSFFSTAITALI